ncbi:hypothetical protein GDO81_025941 [Engystomops pustulosus]|uniref:Taste receptor type 2 n=1 Tax=Engystomops pustulosus TaxID=76066 RepID=A0AAV6ZJ56_ENGPU|nr:hypothetical protein GDO81_025941 [Engystomops pustulosus]
MSAQSVLLLFSIVASCSGLPCNIFISIICGRTWIKDGFPGSVDLILLALGSAQVLLQMSQLVTSMLLVLRPDCFLYGDFCSIYLYNFVHSSIFFVSCMVSSLCMFYSIKIVSFQGSLLILLKSRLSAWLPWLIVSSLVLSCIFFFALSYVNLMMDGDHRLNITMSSSMDVALVSNSLNAVLLLPFFLILVLLGSIVTSLAQHALSLSHLHYGHLKAHVGAARTMILLLVLNVFFHLSQITFVLELSESSVWRWLSLIFYYFFCPLQTWTLVLGNKKLNFISELIGFMRRKLPF